MNVDSGKKGMCGGDSDERMRASTKGPLGGGCKRELEDSEGKEQLDLSD